MIPPVALRHSAYYTITFLSRVVLNLDQKEHCLGLLYVAVSRVKALQGLMFERPFDFDRFASIESIVARDRDIDTIYRINNHSSVTE